MDTLLTFLQTKYIRKLDCNLRFLLDKYSIEEIVKEIIGWLKVDSLNYFDTTTFARDFYIGSNLTEEEKEKFYNELERQGFFLQLNDFLTSDNFSVCSWTIYTIGKFSNETNASFLETAYETNYRLTNPILSYRCLNELSWLSSKNINQYLSDLERDNSITSRLILLYYWETSSDNSKFKELFTDKEFINFISPNQTLVDIEEEICDRLFAFENYISDLYNSTEKNIIDKNEFESIAKNYFKTYLKVIDIQAEKEHQDFLKQLGED